MAFGDSLEQSRLADVGKTNNTTLQVVARSTQKNLFLNDGLFGRHLAAAFLAGVVAGGDTIEGGSRSRKAASRRSSGRGKTKKRRACCGMCEEAGKRNEGGGG